MGVYIHHYIYMSCIIVVGLCTLCYPKTASQNVGLEIHHVDRKAL